MECSPTPEKEKSVTVKEEKLVTTTIVYNFSSTNCHRCRLFLPTFQAWAAKYGDKADFVVVHLDKATQDVLEQFAVTVVPTVVVLRDAKVVARIVGVPKEEEIARLLQEPPSRQEG
jgi:thioredoxin-like negative regulator of GroEL